MAFFQPAIVKHTSGLDSPAFRDDTTYIVFNEENKGVYVKSYNNIIRFGGFDVYDNLISFSPTNPLSSNMGRILDNIKISYSDIVNNLDGTTLANPSEDEIINYYKNQNPNNPIPMDNLITKVLSAHMGKVLDDKIMEVDNHSIWYTDIVSNFNDERITSNNNPLSASLGYILFTTLHNYMNTADSRLRELEARDNIDESRVNAEINDLKAKDTYLEDIINSKELNINNTIESKESEIYDTINSKETDLYKKIKDTEVSIRTDLNKENFLLSEKVQILKDHIDVNISTFEQSLDNIKIRVGENEKKIRININDIASLLLTTTALDRRIKAIEDIIDDLSSNIPDVIKLKDVITDIEDLRNNYSPTNPDRDKKIISAGIAYDLDQRTRVMRVNMLKHNAPPHIYATMLNGPNEVVMDGNTHVTVWSYEGQAIKTNQLVRMVADEGTPIPPENRRSGKFVTMLA